MDASEAIEIARRFNIVNPYDNTASFDKHDFPSFRNRYMIESELDNYETI
jgi:hypothetical protein